MRVFIKESGPLPRRVQAILIIVSLFLLITGGIFTYNYIKFLRLIDARLGGQVFQNSTSIYTAPRIIAAGDVLSPNDVAGYLLRAGYSQKDSTGAPGRLIVSGSSIEVRPSANSYFAGHNALRLEFSGRRLSRIRDLEKGGTVSVAQLEPELLTNMFDDQSREKRRPLRFEDLPRPLINAVLSAEDRRYFDHAGFDPIRIIGAAWADLRSGTKAQGASTITMQVARSFFFSTRREWRRKLSEIFVALQLEKRFSKQQIFELYANQIYLGNRGSFAIRGFGEAAEAYFGKDVRQLNLAETAFLAGIIRSPNRYSSAERKPERAAEARDFALAQMVDNRALTHEVAEAAKKLPLRLVRGTLESNSSAYFVDMVKDQVLDRFSEKEMASAHFRIYTTLDPVLQRAAAEAVEIGLKRIDTLLNRRYARWRKRGEEVPLPQIALVALDPATGSVEALIGGRDYGQSQLNHVLAQRQPGSVFKPIVYAAAFTGAVEGETSIITPATTVVDEPTTFSFEGKPYSPDNYGQEYYGSVTLRDALTHSLNVATVKVAEMAGYGRVVEVARRLGAPARIQPTPAIALGAYEMTPLEVAGSYTMFASMGTGVEPYFVDSVFDIRGLLLDRAVPRRRPGLDRRVAYLVTNILEDVVDRGTGAGVRSLGFYAPAAGKTGTSHDGWFAGFTSKLVCVVWAGFDDNRELGLSGATSAAPIWAEFMKRAVAAAGYRDVRPFARPDGVTTATIDPQTGLLAGFACPAKREEVFIEGTEPTEACSQHGGGIINRASPVSWLKSLFGFHKKTSEHVEGAGVQRGRGGNGKWKMENGK